MNFCWDKVNKWLYIGNHLTFMFDDWLSWFGWLKSSSISKLPILREWTLFQIMWDNGSWWFLDLNDAEKETVKIPHMDGRYIINDEYTKRTGKLNCFIQVKILGFGIRFGYKREITAVQKSPNS